MRAIVTSCFVLVASALAFDAQGATQATAPAGGGLATMSVTVDLKAGEVRADGARIPIALDRALMPDDAGAKDVVTEVVAIGEGKHVVHVRVPAKGASGAPHWLAWEAVLAAGRAPIFAGVTGLTEGDDGERTGKMVQIVAKDDGTSFVIVARTDENLHVCGQAMTPLAPEVLTTKLELRGATLQRLSREQRDAARKVVATAKGGPADVPLAKLLVATGSSVPSRMGGALTDGDPSTVWSEQRPGAGQGEFVMMRAPSEVPITKLAIVVAPPKAAPASAPSHANPPALPNGAAPKSFYLVTDTQTIAVTMPEDAWMHPGAAYVIDLGEPLRASCLTLVLDEAYAQGAAKPDVSIAELYAYSEFDGPGASLEKTAQALAGGGGRAIAAAAVLKRAGDAALAPVEAAFDSLDTQGRQLAADIATGTSTCEASAPLLIRAMTDPAPEVSRKGRLKLERCGKSATTALVQSLKTNPKGRALVAPMLATLAPDAALEPLAEIIGEGEPELRAALRAAWSRATRETAKERLAAIVSDAKRSPNARVEILRATGSRLKDVAPEANAAIAEMLAAAPPLRIRYLLMLPIAELVRAGDATATARLAEIMAKDGEWPVRARAAEVAEGIAADAARDALIRASKDPEPRVREAALRAMGPSDAARVAATDRLAHDGWSFVRAAALDALSGLPASADVDAAVAGALKDKSPRVRAAAAEALGVRHARAFGDALRARVDDADEELEVRVASTRALGGVCHAASIDRLTKLARTAAAPADDKDVQIGMAAVEALSKLHPADLAARLAPFNEKTVPPFARKAAQDAVQAKGECH